MPRIRAAAVVLASLSLAAAATAAYEVQPGDTLSAIASAHGVAVSDLVEANDIADPDLIFAGQLLTIPAEKPVAGASAPGERRFHVVAAGDTLGSIASRYGTTVTALAAANVLPDANRIYPGQRLWVVAPLPTAEWLPGAGETHLVRAGDTLATIGTRYQTKIAAIAAHNGIADPNVLVAGTTLEIPTWVCPLPGSVFIDDYGFPRSGARLHQGNDLFAPAGTPVLAPVAGEVEQIDGERGGLQFWLRGDDGTTYIGSHLQSFGESGRVRAGAVIGYIGTSGNAAGAKPHLHFELQPHESGSVNPFPTLSRHCPR